MPTDADHSRRSASRICRFGNFEVDFDAGQIRKRGLKLRLPGQSFEILRLLLERHGAAVTNEELSDRLWAKGSPVDTKHLLMAAISKLRGVLGDSTKRPRYIETLPRRGYRFIARIKPPVDIRPPRRIRSVAVLPLKNLSGDPEKEYFADGMTEALINHLAKISALRVTRTSAMRYKETHKSVPEIAQELDVDGVVEGSVSRYGKRLRINVRLVHAGSGTCVWAESYQRDLRDVFGLQAEVAQAIARKIRIKVTPRERARLARPYRAVPAAHEAYMMGRFHWNKRTPQGLRKSLEFFQLAIEKDPNYALAYSGLADAYTGCASFFHDIASPLEVMPKARSAAQKALHLDKSLAEAHATLAFISSVHDYDWKAAERSYRRALSLDPSYAVAIHWHAMNLAYQGKLSKAQAEIERAREIEPPSLPININVAAVFYFRRDYDRAIEQARRTLELDATFYNAHIVLSFALMQKEMLADALAEAKKAAALSGNCAASLGCIGGCYAALDRTSKARKIIGELQELSRRQYVSSFVIGWVYSKLRDKEAALAHLESAYAERSVYLSLIKIEPSLDFLRSDPRFQDLQRRVGLSL
jgi:TolB-like protein/tetratricopeptide (TPR) repeat protein